MAVVVQEMAACDSAGVAFSIHPVSGDLNVAVINANFGLGESVVSGECDVDHIEVDKTSGEIITSRIADKSMFTEVSAGGGTANRETDATSRHEAVLSDANIAAIIALLKQAETYFHFLRILNGGLRATASWFSSRGRSRPFRPAGLETNRPNDSRMRSPRWPGILWRPASIGPWIIHLI